MRDSIEIIGARQNNLKNISVKIPRNKLTVITGVSGSGKSSLAFDVIFGEGQRLFLESLSTYARSRVVQVRRPDVDFVYGLSSVISIEQHQGVRNNRSTVGTLTDVSTYLRLLYSSMGEAYCPYCQEEIPIKTINQILEHLLSLETGTFVEILAPVFKIYGETYHYLFNELRRRGIGKIRINDEEYDIGEKIDLDETKEYKIQALIDKIEISSDLYQRIVDTLKDSERLGGGFIQIKSGKYQDLIADFTCPNHFLVMAKLKPWYFSPNESDSACLTCNGLGVYRKAVPYLIVENESLSIVQGAINSNIFNINHPFKYLVLFSLARHYNFDLEIPFNELSEEIKDIIFYGTKEEKFELIKPPQSQHSFSNIGKKVKFEGLIPPIDRWYKQRVKAQSQRQAQTMEEHVYFRGMIDITCPDCKGTKLLPHRLQVKIQGKNIHDLGEMNLTDVLIFLKSLHIQGDRQNIEGPIIEELIKRLSLLCDIGVGYLSLNREAHTLSGGETQRVRMSTQIGSGLMGMLYILDEPSIGLHQRDNYKIIHMLKKLRDLGNTVIVVEHDIEMIESADWIIDIGPGSGSKGGEIKAQGIVDEIKKSKDSITGQYLSGIQKIALPKTRREINRKLIQIIGARVNNLKNINVTIPLNSLVCITGVSGSGKSSLINDVLSNAILAQKDRRIIPGDHDRIENLDDIKEIRIMDQSPIGRSSRSNPATYIGFYNKLREVFSKQPESVKRGYTKTTFTYNSKDSGRCEECEGTGEIITQLQFMPDVRTLCPVCKGRRFKNEVLEVTFQGLNIAEVMNLSVEEAIPIFKEVRLIRHKLKVMNDLGLGYLKLGQSSTTLSGGEAQRIKLANELGKLKRKENSLYVFDEPSIGLHLADIKKLLQCIDKLINAGNSVIIIEHNLEIIKTADYVVDLGPEGGNQGGNIVATGTPEQVASVKESYTGQYLKTHLNDLG